MAVSPAHLAGLCEAPGSALPTLGPSGPAQLPGRVDSSVTSPPLNMSVNARPEVRALQERGARPRPSLPVPAVPSAVGAEGASEWLGGGRSAGPSVGPGFRWKLFYEQPFTISGNGAQGTEHRDTGTRFYREWQGLRLTCDLRP